MKCKKYLHSLFHSFQKRIEKKSDIYADKKKRFATFEHKNTHIYTHREKYEKTIEKEKWNSVLSV